MSEIVKVNSKEVKVKINNFDDRASMVSILAAAGCKVWIKKVKGERSYKLNYYVCFDVETPHD